MWFEPDMRANDSRESSLSHTEHIYLLYATNDRVFSVHDDAPIELV